MSIDWGFVPGLVTYQEFPLAMTNVPSNVEKCFTYDRRNYYMIIHKVKDNAAGSDWVRSPVVRMMVTK
jgi:hypothetical protein